MALGQGLRGFSRRYREEGACRGEAGRLGRNRRGGRSVGPRTAGLRYDRRVWLCNLKAAKTREWGHERAHWWPVWARQGTGITPTSAPRL